MKAKLITLLICATFYMNGLVAQNSSLNLRLSPQPVYHQLSINFVGQKQIKQQNIILNVYDLLGNLVRQQSFQSFNTSKKLEIELGELSSGMYLLIIEGDVRYPTQRFIKS